MKWFYDLKISKKLIFSFLLIIILVTGLGIFAITQLDKVNKASSDMATNWLPSIRTLSQLKLSLERMRSLELQHILASEPSEFDRLEQSMNAQLVALAGQQKEYVAEISEPQEKAMYPEVVTLIQSFLVDHQKIIALSRADKNDEARLLLKGTALTTFRVLEDKLEKLVEVNDRGAAGSNKLADDTYSGARIWIIVMLLLCISAALLLALSVARLISRPLVQAVEVAQRVAGGDLTANIKSAGKDETGQLLRALKSMNDSLLNIVGEVRAGTDTISSASSQIASGNLDLSSRTEEQASSLEQTASAMEELTSTVRQNADNARQANQLAVSASEIAASGGTVVGKVVNTMGSINESSRKIVDIISVIDGIAFQTNILALNAAVEAARAGEQGRGFAVVASEVRILAQRSAAAAKEIKVLIDNSVLQVNAGSKLVEEAGNTMSDVVSSVKRVTDIVGEITSASQEQSDGLGQINLAITQMDQATQQNAALVEQAAAAAQSLQDQAILLAQVVSIFKLDESHHASSPQASTIGLSKNVAQPVLSER